LFDAALHFKARFLARKLTLALLQGFTLDGGCSELIVELIEKSPDVRGLCRHLRASSGDDFGLETETGSDIKTG
jgi:hypothetical protein